MKRAVSVSIGSSTRDKSVEVELLGERVRIERIGTDGDMEAAADLYAELDGKVDAFGVGGADLGLEVDGRWYPLHSVKPMVRKIKTTPVVDGTGLKNTLEAEVARVLDEKLPQPPHPKRVLVTVGADRWGMTVSFLDAGYDCVFGDLMFGLGIPVVLRSRRALTSFARVLMPIAGRLPFSWVYPTGEKQEVRTPKWTKYYRWATVIAGDCHYVKHYMPDDMSGKIIVTNTTTTDDVALFKSAGVTYLVTTTPVLEGRSFGTNMMEAALVAVAGKGRTLTRDELREILHKLELEPQVHPLNP
jgi:hypothetical protein